MTEYNLSMEILELSKANTWDKAKKEWFLDSIHNIPKRDEPETCLCGHYPIREVCLIKNRETGKETIVGNCCVKKFIGLNTNKLFSALKRVEKDNSKSLNEDIIELAHKKGIINNWEHVFYIDIWKKRKLSRKQLNIKKRINKSILSNQDNFKKNKN